MKKKKFLDDMKIFVADFGQENVCLWGNFTEEM